MNLLAKEVLGTAVEERASDVFIFPAKANYEIKLRTAAGLRQVKEIDFKTGKELLNYFKFQAQMDITEHRRPQVGSYQNYHKFRKCLLAFFKYWRIFWL